LIASGVSLVKFVLLPAGSEEEYRRMALAA
jgi:hypothetical protein